MGPLALSRQAVASGRFSGLLGGHFGGCMMKSPLFVAVLGLMVVGGLALALFNSALAQDAQPVRPDAARWEVHLAETSYSASADGQITRAINTLLVNTATGDTWLLWPTQEGGQYGWLPVNKHTPKP
jgi:hypothetical protein